MAAELVKSGTKHPYNSTECWPVATTLLYLAGQLLYIFHAIFFYTYALLPRNCTIGYICLYIFWLQVATIFRDLQMLDMHSVPYRLSNIYGKIVIHYSHSMYVLIKVVLQLRYKRGIKIM